MMQTHDQTGSEDCLIADASASLWSLESFISADSSTQEKLSKNWSSPLLSGAPSRKRSLSPSAPETHVLAKKPAPSTLVLDSQSKSITLQDSVSSAPPPPPAPEKNSTNSTRKTFEEIYQDTDECQSLCDKGLHFLNSLIELPKKEEKKFLTESEVAALNLEASKELWEAMRKAKETGASPPFSTTRKRMMSSLWDELGGMSVSSTSTGSASNAQSFSSTTSSRPRESSASKNPLLEGPWNEATLERKERELRPVVREIERVHRISMRAKYRRNKRKRSLEQRAADFAASLDVAPHRLEVLGLIDPYAKLLPVFAPLRRSKLVECERDGCKTMCQSLSGVCKAHSCIYRGCNEPQFKSGFCKKHRMDYYHIIRPE